MGSREITVPDAGKAFEQDTYIRFIFTAKNGYSTFAEGEEVCFDQIKLHTAEKKAVPYSGEAPKCTETPLEYRIEAGGVSYTFSRRTAQFTGISANGRELLSKPVEYNFFRAPVDNDTMKWDWYSAHLNEPEVKVYRTEISEEMGCAVIKAEQSFGWSIHQPFARLTAVYRIDGRGELEVECEAEFSNKVELLPRFGLRFFMPGEFDKVSYYGFGPCESYIDKHQASYVGSFAASIEEMHEDYIRPQENSSHFGCTRMSVTDGSSILTFTDPEGFSFNASEYTQEELASKGHNFELEKCGHSVICADFAMAGVGSAACGPRLADKYRIALPKVSGRIRISIV